MNARLQYKGSDHTAFEVKGVPAISLRSGAPLTAELDDKHPEYHQPGDKAEYIRPELLQEAAEYNYQIITHLANTDQKLVDPRFFTSYIHRDATVIDMHCDTISRYMAGEDLKKDLPTGHIDIPKLKRGSVDLQVFAAYVAVPRSDTEKITAAKRAFDMIDATHRLIVENPDDLSLVLGPGDVAPLKTVNKTGILIGIEGGYAIENDLSLLRSFYKAGVRLMTLTHWNRTDWADASGDEKAELGGLTAFGEQVVQEMNKLGMIIDVSHAHDETFWDVLRVSTKPVVASHSCARDLSDHFRNLSDDMLKALAKNGGVIGINFAPGFLNVAIDRKHNEILAELAKKHGLPENPMTWTNADPALRDKALAEARERMSQFDVTVDVKTVVNHIDHVVKVIGNADNVGLGSDFDGIESTPKGLENIGKISAITEELRARGYKEADIRKILGGNFMRVFNAVTRK
jgi:membrane dipeptidase